MTQFDAACHCGALTATFRTSLLSTAWTVRACQCGFCRVHAAVTASDPGGQLRFDARPAEHLQRYHFAAHTADFLICHRCGVYMGAVADIDGARFGLLNLRTLRQMPEMPAPTPMSYDGESAQERRARRASRWTPLLPDSL